ncbi:anti-virulence regulator CigR family protein, partial [Deltaproteobacteria bacterium OttesenSCG-928-K17]|nr:anti-virulence regulator CigR family protein [Deltaproteobacteria bacterium OttesenSCG-928-K17]
RPNNDRPGHAVNRPNNDRPGQSVNRPNNDRPGQAVNRPHNDRPGQAVNRPSNDRPGHAVNRPNNDRPGQAVNRPHYNRPNPQSQGLNRHKAWQMAREHKLTGYKAVPKNYRQKMVKGRPLPSKVKHRPVPGPMRHRLPAYRGYEWHMVGRDLVLVAVGTLVIYEIFQNVFD